MKNEIITERAKNIPARVFYDIVVIHALGRSGRAGGEV